MKLQENKMRKEQISNMEMKNERRKLLEVKNLKQYFNAGTKNEVRAVDDISFDVYEGETLGLVGESGCGKTTTGRSIIRLYDPTSGEIHFDGSKIHNLDSRQDQLNFRRNMQMIFQDPYASLNPRMKVRDIIAEGLEIHGLAKNEKEVDDRVIELLELVGLDKDHSSRYPHEFSGGQRQRIGVARALAVDPKMIIADEPISALDVSIQAQVVNLLMELQEKQKLTFLFIAHDLSMVKYISDRIAVMYFGKLVELASADDVYNRPLHPYTESLLSAIPLPDPEHERTRQRFTYTPRPENDEEEKMREIAPGHYVYCRESDVANLQEKLANYD